MPPTINAIPGDPAANSYVTEAEVDAYFDARLPLSKPWVPAATLNRAAIVMATRTLDANLVPHKRLIRQSYRGGVVKYYLISPEWTGFPATLTQSLAWPRSGMTDRLLRNIPIDVIPDELKNAICEMAGQYLVADRTLDNEAIVQGITSVRAGSVSISFAGAVDPWVIPAAVINLMPKSWFTDEIYQPAEMAEFDVITPGSNQNRHDDDESGSTPF